MRRLAPALALCVMLAACDRPAGNAVDNVANAANASGNDMAANEADNAAEPVRSILRPEVAEPEVPKIEPLDATIAFGTSGLSWTMPPAPRSTRWSKPRRSRPAGRSPCAAIATARAMTATIA